MELSKLVNSVQAVVVTGDLQKKDINAVVYDSRKVVPGSLFVAIKGYQTDGHTFVMDAVGKGAAAVVVEDGEALPEHIEAWQNLVKIVVKDSRKALADLSHAFYRNPSEKLDVIGVTGTKGKTTTTYFLKSIFEQAGEKTGLIGTIANYIGEEQLHTTMTTPESADLHELFARMVKEDCTRAVMEISSHSLYLKRVSALLIKAAIFTNIASDHLDFHNTFDEYLAAKRMLFDMLDENAVAVINADDPSASNMIAGCKAKIFSYGTTDLAGYRISDISVGLDGTVFTITYGSKSLKLRTSLIGEFNAYNAAAAFTAAVQMGIPESAAAEGVERTPLVPGRFEVLTRGSKKVIIDYSHTAGSLEQALINLRRLTSEGQKIYTVFGCGGDRDKTKRPVMGEIAARLSDVAIVTSDNPRTEDPLVIIEEIKTGMKTGTVLVEPDREQAIKLAVFESEDDAVILIAGKGHEDYQVIGTEKQHFSDKEIAEKFLRESVV